ncbi:MAG: DUF3826 domain-containing protein [Bacteroidetes bacterium]|jgi:hypothetical protein|nr:DUF3826 domain-containing protein [Bacteroidota bacterium]
MRKKVALYSLLIGVCLLLSGVVDAQQSSQDEAAYLQTITLRANKIVQALSVTDSTLFYQVQNMVANQYAAIKNVHDNFNKKAKEETANATSIEAERMAALKVQHNLFIASLSSVLSVQQIDVIKDGMTYGVLPKTFKGYEEMILTLTPAQKNQIYAYLIEAREFAMDAESSEKKHAWFGKFKGKINNYLSAEGYDMKKEGIAWKERIAAQQNISK